MNRTERRKKERELKKQEERLRKQEKRLSEAMPRESRLKRVAGIILGIITFGFALVGYYAVARPHVSIEPSLPLNPFDPYSTQFTLKNENPISSIYDIHCGCWPRRMESGNGFSVISPGPLSNIQHTILLLNPGSSSTVDCPAVLGGIGAWSGEVLSAELELGVSYKQSWWPFGTVTERNSFMAERDSQHGVHWVHITPAEEGSLFPQTTGPQK
jgi:hypothetical protein